MVLFYLLSIQALGALYNTKKIAFMVPNQTRLVAYHDSAGKNYLIHNNIIK